MDHRARDNAELGELMAAAQAGDRHAYRVVLDAILPVLRRTIRAQNRGIGAADLEDLVQDALLSIHQVRASYDPGRPFLPWVKAIARNRAVDWARRQSRRRNEAADTDGVETYPAAETNSIDRDGVGDPEALRLAITQLPEGQRRAVEMLKLKEMSLREASAATGSSVSALKVACHRGMKALRAVLTSGG